MLARLQPNARTCRGRAGSAPRCSPRDGPRRCAWRRSTRADRPGRSRAYRWLAQQPQGGAIELPILEWAIAPTLTYQYATLSHGHPIVNGYSGYGSSLQEFLGGAASPLNDLDRIEDALVLLRCGRRALRARAPGATTKIRMPAPIPCAAIRAHPALASEEFRSDAVVAFRLAGRRTAGAARACDGAPAARC